MDRGGGCCIARYSGDGQRDMNMVDRIMLKFRPIAPKPVSSTSGSVSGGGAASPENSGYSVKTKIGGKRKRAAKYSNNITSKKRNYSRKRKSEPEKEDSGGSIIVGERVVKTLSLLPERPGVKEHAKITSNKNSPLWLSFGNGINHLEIGKPVNRMAGSMVAGSWVKMEQVIDTWVVDYDLYGNLGRTDEERMVNLGRDTCPCIISDGENGVKWINEAYRRMVVGEGTEGEVAAWVVMDEGVTVPVTCTGFTCRVRVVTCGKLNGCKTVPCDVWRLDCGGFAWRLDTEAALSLGR